MDIASPFDIDLHGNQPVILHMLDKPENFQFIYGLFAFLAINLLFAISFLRNEKHRFPLVLILTSILSLIIGIRGRAVGLDSAVYANFFSGSDEDISEPFFYVLRWLTFYNIELAFVAVAWLTNFYFLLSFKKINIHYPLIFAIYISTFIYINLNINIIRQGLAMAFFAYAAAMLLSSSNKKYFYIYGALAVLTHFSAFIPLLGLHLVARFENKSHSALLPLLLICVVLQFINFSEFILPFIEYSNAINKIYWYLTWDIGKSWSFKHVYYLILMLLIAIFFINYANKGVIFKVKSYYLSFIFLIYGFSLVFLFRQEEMFADRIFYYFFFFVPQLIFAGIETIKYRLIVLTILLVCMNIWFFKSIVMQYPNWFVPPYESIRF